MSDNIIQLNEDLIKHDLKDRLCQVLVGTFPDFLYELSIVAKWTQSGWHVYSCYHIPI